MLTNIILCLFLVTNAQIILSDKSSCNIYQIINKQKFTTMNVTMLYVPNLCTTNNNYHSAVLITELKDCSPETMIKNINSNTTALILVSQSLIEDTLWNTKYATDTSIYVLIMLSECNIDLKNYNSTNYVQITPSINPFNIYFIIIAILAQIWNLFNLILCSIGMYQMIIHNRGKISSTFYCFINELILGVIRIFYFVEPLPFNVYLNFLSYNILSGINLSLCVNSIFFICFSFLRGVKQGRELMISVEVKKISDYMNKNKYVLGIFLIILIINIILNTLKGLYIQIIIVEKIMLVLYLIYITIIFLIYVVTHIEFQSLQNLKNTIGKKRKTNKFTLMGTSIFIFLVGTIVYLLVPVGHDYFPLKIVPLMIGFLSMSTSSLLLYVEKKHRSTD